MIAIGWHHNSQTEEYILSGTDNRGFTREFVSLRNKTVRLSVEVTSTLSNAEVADAELLLRHIERTRSDVIFPLTDQMTAITQDLPSSSSVTVGLNRDYWLGYLMVFRADGTREFRKVANPGEFLPPENPNVVSLEEPITLNAGDEVFPAFQGFLREGGSISRSGFNANSIRLKVETRFRFQLVKSLPVLTPIIGKETPTPLSEGLETVVRLPQTFYDNGLGPVEGVADAQYLNGRKQLTFRPQGLAEKRALRDFFLSLQGKVGRFIIPDFSVNALGVTLPVLQNDVAALAVPRSGVSLDSFVGDYLVARVGQSIFGSRIIGVEEETLVFEPFPVNVPEGSPVGLGAWARSDANTLSFEHVGPTAYRLSLVARETDGPTFDPVQLNPKVRVTQGYVSVWANEIPPSFPVDVTLVGVLVAETGLPSTGL